ncbi:4-hydroxythreonine-4-phosphate dehydrogenase PdxA [Mesorhizobium sp. ES1-1]|uniref:4-hydroxythreonine-4-phosphate dehydrogenase PdxA n=1 Tax=Mesorhizobium sp. ES1-1 TaxID=2876629 RepID=UPI001CCB1E29|nr:4-hydroxythreonine-4-phosphate dehydrogenase PdxA [Mesorhizobium sp. ES1-1]MBZ9674696.1 4-hydroxythreonine-4-phosphate dehydrogenase PdxA [Mesorhizobium sp. ES1-1]
MTPTIAITVGDPAGVGPEIALKASRHLAPQLERGAFRLRLIGSLAVLSETARSLDLPLPTVATADEPLGIWPIEGNAVGIGQVSAQGGNQAYQAVVEGVRRTMAGEASAIVTAPLNKESLHLAGHQFPGHTELLAALTKARDSAMMLAHGSFRVSHVTTHIALEDVPKRATEQRMRRVLDLTIEALKHLGIVAPRVAVAALNPHAGEGGIFGTHDIRVTEPIVADYRARGHDVHGPVPGDTVFVKMRGGSYDAVVAMYHDQGHIPVKLLGFQIDPQTGEWLGLSGVNITLGLPIVRTSVDHGTAFDIAGRGIARESSLIEAIDYALSLTAEKAA